MAERPSPKLQARLMVGAIVCALLALVPAQTFIAPAARQLEAAERVQLPTKQKSLILLGADLPDYARFRKELVYDPYLWAPALPLSKRDDVALDAPWMDQKIAPLAPAPASPIILDDVAQTTRLHTNSLLGEGHSLPAASEATLVSKAALLVYAGSPAEISQGLTGQLTPEEAKRFQCYRAQDWFLVCEARANP